MIVPMKKVSLIIRDDKKEAALKILRKLGIIHIEISEGNGEKLDLYKAQIALLERAIFAIGKPKKVEQKELDIQKALDIANQIELFTEEKTKALSEKAAISSELERIKDWGNINPDEINALAGKGLELEFYEMSKREYNLLLADKKANDADDKVDIEAVRLNQGKSTVKFLIANGSDAVKSKLSAYQFALPKMSTEKMNQRFVQLCERINQIDSQIAANACYVQGINKIIKDLEKKIEFETYFTGMQSEALSERENDSVSVAYFNGYIEAENLDSLKETAKENSWGLLIQEPTVEDNVPTKLKNNKFVSLIYPIMDFLGTVPGYFEYDISGWFLMFILIFFGIIFGDGGYGLLICAVAAVPIVKNLIKKEKVSPLFLLVGLFGLSTVLWGTLTCTWFGLSPDFLPKWLKMLSVPVISNVYADKIWTLPWTSDGVGLTTAQNLQIFCFSLALIQLTVAHIMGTVRNRKSIKLLGDVGSILQLFGIYYLVLSLVVNPDVFSFGLVIGVIPVGIVAIVLIGVGFVMSFVFSNYEGSIGKSILASLKNIVSVLLGVVNVFSDIVSYIRLWAVGLAGAAISATVNELVSPLLGNFMFMIFALILLVFGHGLNMILNVLSVIVHGIRLNTLEFSSHLDMSWSGHKFKPFEN